MIEKSPPPKPQTAGDLFDEMLVVMAQECWLAILKGLSEVKRLQVQLALLSENKR